MMLRSFLFCLIAAPALLSIPWAAAIYLYRERRLTAADLKAPALIGVSAEWIFGVQTAANPVQFDLLAASTTFLTGTLALILTPRLFFIWRSGPGSSTLSPLDRMKCLRVFGAALVILTVICSIATVRVLPHEVPLFVRFLMPSVLVLILAALLELKSRLIPTPKSSLDDYSVSDMMEGSKRAEDARRQPSASVVQRIDALYTGKRLSTVQLSELYALFAELIRRNETDTLPHLARYLTALEPDPFFELIRRDIVEALGKMNALDYSALVAAIAKRDSSPKVRHSAVLALAKMSADPTVAPEARRLFASEPLASSTDVFWTLADRNPDEALKLIETFSGHQASILVDACPKEMKSTAVFHALVAPHIHVTGDQLSSISKNDFVAELYAGGSRTVVRQNVDSRRMSEVQARQRAAERERAEATVAVLLNPSRDLWAIRYDQLAWAIKNRRIVSDILHSRRPAGNTLEHIVRRLVVLAAIGDPSGFRGLYDFIVKGTDAERVAAVVGLDEVTSDLVATPAEFLITPTLMQVGALLELALDSFSYARESAIRVCDTFEIDLPVDGLAKFLDDPSARTSTDYAAVAKRDREGVYLDKIFDLIRDAPTRDSPLAAIQLYLSSPHAAVRKKAITYIEEFLAREAESESVEQNRSLSLKYNQSFVALWSSPGAPEAIPLLTDIVANAPDATSARLALHQLITIDPECALRASMSRGVDVAASYFRELYPHDQSGELTEMVLSALAGSGWKNLDHNSVIDCILRRGTAAQKSRIVTLLREKRPSLTTKMVSAWAIKGLDAETELERLRQNGIIPESYRIRDPIDGERQQTIPAIKFLAELHAANLICILNDDVDDPEVEPARYDEIVGDILKAAAHGTPSLDLIHQVCSATFFTHSVWSLEVVANNRLYALHFSGRLESSEIVSLVERILEDAGINVEISHMSGEAWDSSRCLIVPKDRFEKLVLDYCLPVSIHGELFRRRDEEFEEALQRVT